MPMIVLAGGPPFICEKHIPMALSTVMTSDRLLNVPCNSPKASSPYCLVRIQFGACVIFQFARWCRTYDALDLSAVIRWRSFLEAYWVRLEQSAYASNTPFAFANASAPPVVGVNAQVRNVEP